MSYTTGTKLSYNYGRDTCTVITRGRVQVTKADGRPIWGQMRLADWLVLAEGIEEADYIPLAPVNYEPACDTGRVKCRPDREMKVASTVAPVAKSPTDYPVGTKLKWRHATNPETYRVAIMTKHGPLQVKSLTDGGADCCFVTKYSYRGKLMTVRRLKKTLFKTTQDWFDSLPEGGYKSVERK